MAIPTPAAPASASGLPQFDLAQWPGQIVWVLITFAILYVLFAKVFLPRVGGAIDAREDRIAGEIGDARRMRDKAMAKSAEAAGEMTQARARARRLADDALAQVKADGQTRRAEEDAALAKVLSAAEAQIALARNEAMVHVRSIAIGAAGAMIERLTGMPPAEAELAGAFTGRPGEGA